MSTDDQVFVSLAGMARLLDCSLDTARKIARGGSVASVQLPGRMRRYRRQDVIRLLEESTTSAVAGAPSQRQGAIS